MNAVTTQAEGVFPSAIADFFAAEMPFNLASPAVSAVEAVVPGEPQPELFATVPTFAPTALDRANEDFRLGAGEMLEPCDEYQDPHDKKWYPTKCAGKKTGIPNVTSQVYRRRK